MLTAPSSPLLIEVEAHLRESVAPQATDLDQSPEALEAALKDLGDRAWLGLKVPKHYGGRAVDPATYFGFQEQVARYSGSLAFLQTQHQSAVSRLAQSPNEALKQAYLPGASRGETLIGVGFSHLRRVDRPPVHAVAVDGGYCIHGDIPWITGFGCFQTFILGAALPDGRALFGLVPFQDTRQQPGGAIAFSEPMQLAAMASTQTVSGHLSDWFLPDDQVLSVQPAGWVQAQDQKGILHHSFFALGCARAALDVVERAFPSLPPSVQAVWTALNDELLRCRTAIYQAQCYPERAAGTPGAAHPADSRLHLRAWSVELAGRCAHAAVIASRGAANGSHHPAQRIYREALAFSVFGQTTAILEASLQHLVQSASPEGDVRGKN